MVAAGTGGSNSFVQQRLEQRSGMGYALLVLCIQGTSALVPPQAILEQPGRGGSTWLWMLQGAAAPFIKP